MISSKLRLGLIAAALLTAAISAPAAPPPAAVKVFVIEGLRTDPVKAYASASAGEYTLLSAKDLNLPYVAQQAKNFRYEVRVGSTSYWLMAGSVVLKPTTCQKYAQAREAAIAAGSVRGFGDACAAR